MAREPKPWRRKGVGGAWYSVIGGKRVWLAKSDAPIADAWKALRRELLAREQGRVVRRGSFTVAEVVSLYVADRREAVKHGALTADSLQGTERFLTPFVERFGDQVAATIPVAPVDAWIGSLAVGARPWNPTTRARCAAMVRLMFGWAVKAGHLDANPMRGLVGPMPLVRDKILTRVQVQQLLDATNEQTFKDLICGLLWTGCRPGELMTLTADRVDLEAQTWLVRDKIRKQTGVEFRTVYLSAQAVELSRRLVAAHPEGAIFRNFRGRPWLRAAMGHRFKRVRDMCGIGGEGVAYSLRHLFITDALERGVEPATVAVLVGHTNIKMIMRVYNKLKQRTDHLRRAVQLITSDPAT